MAYTVKQLAEHSGVSPRALRYYDKIGLLPPAYYAANGYRYYGKKELISLQQILFFRELGFKLEDIKTIIMADEFNQLDSLLKHKRHLKNKARQFKKLINTIDKTILHLKGEVKMKETELYLGFKHPDQIEMANYITSSMGDRGKEIMDQCKASMSKFDSSDLEKIKVKNNEWNQSFKELINKNLQPDSETVQTLIEENYKNNILPYYKPSHKELIQLIELTTTHPTSKRKWDDIHPDFSCFYLQAVKHFINSGLIDKV